MQHWYAVQCKHRQDQRAELHLRNQDFEVFRPLAKVSRRRKGVLEFEITSLFPRYLFIHLDDNDENWSPIRSSRGVADLVRFGDRPTPVPTPVIDHLMLNTAEIGFIDLSVDHFKPNEPVRIMEGPFAGFEAIYAAKKAEDRVIILLNFMQQAQRLVVPIHTIERI